MPGASNVHIDAALTQITVGYKNPALVGTQLFPEVPVLKQSDKYWLIGKEAFNLTDDTRRPGTRAKSIDFTLSNDPFYCDGHALNYDLPDEVRSNADTPIADELTGVEFTTDRVQLNQEYDIASKARDASAYPSTNKIALSGSDKWSDYTGSDPIEAFETGKTAVFEATLGAEANIAVIPKLVWDKLRNHPALLERIKYSQKGIVTEELLAELIGIPNIVIAKALFNSAKEGQTPVADYVWGKDVIIAHRPDRPGLKTIALGYNFLWNKGGMGGGLVTRWREEDRKTDVLMVERYYDNKLIVPGAGYLIQNAVA